MPYTCAERHVSGAPIGKAGGGRSRGKDVVRVGEGGSGVTAASRWSRRRRGSATSRRSPSPLDDFLRFRVANRCVTSTRRAAKISSVDQDYEETRVKLGATRRWAEIANARQLCRPPLKLLGLTCRTRSKAPMQMVARTRRRLASTAKPAIPKFDDFVFCLRAARRPSLRGGAAAAAARSSQNKRVEPPAIAPRLPAASKCLMTPTSAA